MVEWPASTILASSYKIESIIPWIELAVSLWILIGPPEIPPTAWSLRGQNLGFLPGCFLSVFWGVFIRIYLRLPCGAIFIQTMDQAFSGTQKNYPFVLESYTGGFRDSGLLAWLGLEAVALAWPRAALAYKNVGQGHYWWPWLASVRATLNCYLWTCTKAVPKIQVKASWAHT